MGDGGRTLQAAEVEGVEEILVVAAGKTVELVYSACFAGRNANETLVLFAAVEEAISVAHFVYLNLALLVGVDEVCAS